MIRTKTHLAALAAILLALGACSPAASEETSDQELAPSTTVETSTNVETSTTAAPTTSAPAGPSPSTSAPGPTDQLDITRGVPFTDTLTLDVFSPGAEGQWPVVVFFHGGSWYGGAKENVEPFAIALAERGFVVFNATYRTGQLGGGYPQSYEDIGCAIGLANTAASTYGGDPGRVFVAGHSAGAHLASTVLFGSQNFSEGDCAEVGAIHADGFIGLAGPYDVTDFAPLLGPWFGGAITEIPEIFAAGSPSGYLETALMPVLLLHGTLDELVPTVQTTGFADALGASGWTVELTLVDGATHGGVIDPLTSADLTIEAIVDFVGA